MSRDEAPVVYSREVAKKYRDDYESAKMKELKRKFLKE
jgi:hypothetical protein